MTSTATIDTSASIRMTVEPAKGKSKVYTMDLGTIAENIAGFAADAKPEVSYDESDDKAVFEFGKFTIYVHGTQPEDVRNAWRAKRQPATVAQELAPVTVECDRCKGWNGQYVWGGTINCKPMFQGTCWKCGGTTRALANGKWAMSG
jgi:hypothetical protein